MGRPIFTVRGKVATPAGAAIPNAYVAIVDSDPDFDDLLGAGSTAEDGSFRLSFTPEAFNQEPLENETTPDLYVVVSVPAQVGGVGPSTLEPKLRHDFGKLAFANGEEDLGTIVVADVPDISPFAPPIPTRVAPGRGKIVKRLRLDQELVEIATREIAPLVERMTGWSDIARGIEIRIVDDYREQQRERIMRELGRELDATQLALVESSARACDASTIASWQPLENAILLNRTLLEEQPFDFLKVTLGHELVHVGQSRVMPEMGEMLARTRLFQWEALLRGQEPERVRLRPMLHALTNIEGYAHYIETRWLRRIYTHAGDLPRPTAEADGYFRKRRQPKMTLASAPPEAPTEDAIAKAIASLDAVFLDKGAQYLLGETFYRMRTKEGRPVPFDPNLRYDESNVFELLAALLVFQAEAAADR